jgi:hypothetical protein
MKESCPRGVPLVVIGAVDRERMCWLSVGGTERDKVTACGTRVGHDLLASAERVTVQPAWRYGD